MHAPALGLAPLGKRRATQRCLDRDAAHVALRRRDLGCGIAALLSDRDPELARETAVRIPTGAPDRIGGCAWPKAGRRTPTYALAVTGRVVDNVRQETDRRAYTAAVKMLKRARSAAQTAPISLTRPHTRGGTSASALGTNPSHQGAQLEGDTEPRVPR